ncbi:hypothetical protein [Leucobacter insecticola]|uniref:hypothetical protein n=1 Tax=Leucobacter insecticola TaxID=2714934 RepID=UPI00198129E2|nr:hypothetical protein [Leucobacter insecticola]
MGSSLHAMWEPPSAQECTRKDHHEHQQHHTLRAPAAPYPYHSLGDGAGTHIPTWAQHRSVYRSSGRTLYIVETDRISDAQLDLKRLARAGWDVRVEEPAKGSLARIALTRRDLAQAA